jgi:hypothetical protein
MFLDNSEHQMPGGGMSNLSINAGAASTPPVARVANTPPVAKAASTPPVAKAASTPGPA